jgi:hypothetical protein
MMANRIFVLNNNNQLIGLEEQQYDTEDLLQSLLANYPALLGSDEIGNEPRRWLLVSRETPVPDMEDASGRWSLDHLFIDQDCIPTLVEVKRSTDTRIRREVVGQMLDYAANAVVHWKIDIIRAKFEAQCQQNNIDPAQMIVEQLGLVDTEAFWENVRTNLLAGKIRLIFVADEIPYELKRIIEFLNKQMNPAEVLGIAIKQFVGQGMKTLVPTVIGQTVEAAQAKSVSRSTYQWDEESFFEVLEQKHGQKIAHLGYAILDWAKSHNMRLWWGYGKKIGSFIPVFDYGGENYTFIALWTSGSVELQFQYMRQPYYTPDKKRQLLTHLNQIQGVNIPEDGLTRRPTFPLKVLIDEKNMTHFLDTLDWFLEEIKAYHD